MSSGSFVWERGAIRCNGHGHACHPAAKLAWLLVAVDASGRAHVLMWEEPVVLVFGASGELVEEWRGKPMTDGHGIHILSDGRIFVVDRDNHRIVLFAPEGGAILHRRWERPRFGAPFNHPTDVATAPG